MIKLKRYYCSFYFKPCKYNFALCCLQNTQVLILTGRGRGRTLGVVPWGRIYDMILGVVPWGRIYDSSFSETNVIVKNVTIDTKIKNENIECAFLKILEQVKN